VKGDNAVTSSMSVLTIILFIAGGALLPLGAESLVRGAARIADSVGVSPLVVGLTVVAFGTSAPELAVSISSAVSGDADVAVGNVVGSNIMNVLFILGLSALVAPLVVSQQLIRLDVPLMIGASVLLLSFALGGRVSTMEGLVLVAGIVVYTVWAIRKSRRERRQIAAEYEQEYAYGHPRGGLVTDLALVLLGVGLLVLGSRWFLNGAIEIAELLGVSELVIGLTIVAAGTSLPEVATSVLASIRGERDIAVGNVVGSNLFNILAVLGLTAVVSDGGVAVAYAALRFDIPVMVAAAVLCLPIFIGGRINRWEGGLFLAYYVAYTVYLLLDSSGHDALGRYSAIMLWFVVPGTVITLGIVTFRTIRRGSAAPA
jgi:cation:H+ antiporter